MGRDLEVRKKDFDVDGKCFTLRKSFVSGTKRGCSKIKNEMREKSMRNR